MAVRVLPMRIGDVDVLVETTAIAGTEETSAVDTVRDKVGDSFERAKETIIAVGKSAADVIKRLSESPAARPSSVELELCLGFAVDGRVIIAGASATANLNVRLVYELAAGEDVTVPAEGKDG